MATGQVDIGAPILDSTINDGEVISDGVVVDTDYDPIVITITATNGDAQERIAIIQAGGEDPGVSEDEESSTTEETETEEKEVITGTLKEFEEIVPDHGDPFADVKVVSGKEGDNSVEDQARQEERQKRIDEAKDIAARLREEQAAKQQDIDDEVTEKKRQQTFLFMGIMGGLIGGLVLYGIVYAIKKAFSHPNEENVIAQSKAMKRIKSAKGPQNQTQVAPQHPMDSSVELPDQFDATKTFEKARQQQADSHSKLNKEFDADRVANEPGNIEQLVVT